MSEQHPNLGKLWVSFLKTSIVLYGGRSGTIASVVVVFAWLALLGLTAAVRLSVAVLGLFIALAVVAAIVAIRNRKGWPAQAMFVWAIRERARLYEGPGKVTADEELATRVNDMIFGGSGGTWTEIRAVAKKLRPAARREHILATADLFENDQFDRSRFDAALAELTTEDERRYWRVRLAMTEAFAAFAVADDCMPILLEAASHEGPFRLPLLGRLRMWSYRFSTSASFLIVGVVAAAAIAIAWGA